MADINHEALNEALTLLGSLMASRQRPQLHLVVCGGSALIALQLVARTTKDVDVLATIEDHHLVCARPLPDWLLNDAGDVRQELRLPEKWLNDGPADPDLFRLGLPEGVLERLHTREFSSCLKIGFIDRVDQIHLKLYAAADIGGQHFSDLRKLQPTPEELLTAARWTFTQDPSEGFLDAVTRVFNALGHADLVTQF
ncbi:MAG: hypothetical protein WCH57_05660 [Verrucomicrobiota bacterium]